MYLFCFVAAMSKKRDRYYRRLDSIWLWYIFDNNKSAVLNSKGCLLLCLTYDFLSVKAHK